MTLKKFDIDEYIAQEEELNSAIKIEDNHIVIRIPDNDFNEVSKSDSNDENIRD